ncbi:helix-turn-helix domain-containing protein [Flammeovirgaceae bacterium SG7u.111]|nr:helix-turn-helix domain-containing protein [Flammeovirgaceae bacterium SG7u.132]WPO34406.1 helix-turn-helix domain-containing protein [Flammeovirgaceae bacterium SG7u.111]MDW7692288.1 helix-turn-helix domain-containing protein [Flammeovirgaceae bacterium SG7u.132]MDW7692617.1 helix-turn-helix domain-containing protein [Flammeovirgaceae bacterium SG7u.132]MDW7693165.1 helix-turn-helix domain-containing protein [Flammeovirgaceae bacterium SG7u.132]
MEKRYITLSASEEMELKTLKKQGGSERERDRAHALLLSNKGHTIDMLRDIFEVRRATISEWFDRWESSKAAGLMDAPKSGRPSIYTVEEQKK